MANATFPGSVAVVIVAAGRGERAGKEEGPKQYRLIGGKPVIWHTLKAFLDHPAVGPVMVAIHRHDEELFREAAGELFSRVSWVHGGHSRQDSTLHALRALEPSKPDAVLIHDAVRPFVDRSLFDRTISLITKDAGALPGLPVADTLKHAIGGTVDATVPRDNLFAAQTPQGFPFAAILAAHEHAAALERADFTDDAAIAEFAGLPVRIVTGSPDNIKLTWARDLAMAELSSSISRVIASPSTEGS